MVRDMLQIAVHNGIDTIDTAIEYGDSEISLGEIDLTNFKIVTKLPALPDKSMDVDDWVSKQVSASLERLNVATVYGLLLHRPEQLVGSNGAALYRALQIIKDKGLAKKIGISIYSPSVLNQLIPKFQLDLVQAPFNLIDQQLYSSGWLQRLKDKDFELHTRSVFLQGLLLMQSNEMPAKFKDWNSLWSRWWDWLAKHNVSPIQACLAFPFSLPEIDRVVVGVTNVIQLEQILNLIINLPDFEFPDIQCIDENLINPSRWPN
jgi:aryl-alcohol dehydrogenase-like predicted oxidoreductase